MTIQSAPFNLLAFPQFWEPPILALNVLVLPKGDPLAFLPPFPDGLLALEAAIIPGTHALPSAAAVSVRRSLDLVIAPNRPALFAAIAAEIPVRAHDNPVAPHPPVQVKKSRTEAYAEAVGGGRSRTPFLVSADEYECVVRDGGSVLPVPPPRDFYWEEIYGFVLRQPLLARELGLLYETSVDLTDVDELARGGYLYVDMAAGSDYSALLRSSFAARIPALGERRRVFASVLFPVDDASNFDHVSSEAVAYDDGFAKIVHASQARTAAVVESARNTTMAPVKDIGIRLGWDDEQVAIWLNRQLGVNAYDPGLTAPGSPLGVASYRVDVFDEAAGQWQSLNRAQGDLALSGIPIGVFDGELGVETLPVNLSNNSTGEFWLPSFFTTWGGGSLVVTDSTPFELSGNMDPIGVPVYSPVGADAVPLRYGHDYQFRVRLADLSGGGPGMDESALNPARSPVAKVAFRRFSPPKSVRAIRTDPAEAGVRTAHYQVFRPVLGYPDILFTDTPNVVADLMTQIAQAREERREPALPDPDATQLRIDISVQTLMRDPLANSAAAQAFVPVYSTTRDFPMDSSEPLELDVEFTDVLSVTGFQAGAPAEGTLTLPSARAVRLTFTPIGKPDDAQPYWGSEDSRVGSAPISLYLSAPSADERKLLLPPALGPQIMAIFLQPDVLRTPVQIAEMAAAGLRHQAPSDLASRLAVQLDVPHAGLTFSAPSGTRTVFACSSGLRHTLNPDRSSISFSAKTDLIHHWLIAMRFTINRDWTWKALGEPAFEVLRDGVVVGQIQLPGILGDAALQQGDREHTSVIFMDAFDPKPGPPPDFPSEINTVYTLRPLFRTPPDDPDGPFDFPLRLPVTTPPNQTPKLVSAGLALGAYQAGERYASTEERTRMLYLQFDGPPADLQDQYFGRVLAYAPDPVLTDPLVTVPDPAEPPLPLDPEEIRVIEQDQTDDLAGFNAMQPLTQASESPGFFLLPLPPGMNQDSPELLGFFVYELRVGHGKQRWCTAQARFGRPLRVAGVQHPAPPLHCSVSRYPDGVRVSSPFATPLLGGRNVRAVPPNTEMYALLYAQVLQVDGQSWRNILILRAAGSVLQPQIFIKEEARFLPSVMQFSQPEIVAALGTLGLPLDSPLSVVVVEMLPTNSGPPNPAEVPVSPLSPVGAGLGQVRILRASVLTPVPAICPPKIPIV
jgi:hypothetical protein